MRCWVSVIGVLGLMGCSKGVLNLGEGAETDARLTSDVYTWDCQEEEGNWMGALGFDVSLVYTPDNLFDRSLPPVNSCEVGLSMFAVDTLEGGTDIPSTDAPSWVTEEDSGRMERVIAGLYFDDVFKNVFSCREVGEVITGGVILSDAGALSGVATPEAGDVHSVNASIDVVGGITFGEEFELDWDVAGWGESFVQIRRARSGLLMETVTCNTTGTSSFVIDDNIWDFLSESLSADTNYLYVGFRNTDNVLSEEGQRIDIETRALHVVGLTEL